MIIKNEKKFLMENILNLYSIEKTFILYDTTPYTLN